MRRAALLAWLAAALCLSAPPAMALDAGARLEQVAAAAAAHPDDPDLAFALALAQHEAGQRADAFASLREIVWRWPGRYPRAEFLLGRLLLSAGDPAGAQVELAAALARDPGSGLLHFYHALALRGLGHGSETAEALATALRLAPALEPEILLVQALDLFDAGDDDAALRLLRRILAIDPTGEAARRVRLILLERKPLSEERWWSLDAHAGFEYDSNVTLESDALPTSSEQSDVRGVWGGGLSLRPLRTDGFAVTLGYRYDQALQRRLSEYDYVNNAGFLSAIWRPTQRFALRLDGVAFNTRLDAASYATVGSLRPNALFSWGGRAGTSRLFADIEWQRYQDTPSISYFERDAEAWGGGFEHYVPLFQRDAWSSLGFRWERTDTHAPVTGRFGGEYDRDLYELRLRLHQPLPWQLETDAWLGWSREDYRYASYFAFAQSFSLTERDDSLIEGRLALSRGVHRLVKLETAYRATRRSSNIDAFDYTRHVVGVYVRVTSE